MGKQVIINLAETIVGDGGVTGKVKSSVLDAGLESQSSGGNIFKKAKVELVQTNTVFKYDLLAPPRPFDRSKNGFWFGLGIDTLMEIRRNCLDADQIYLCAHGSATDRNQVFYDKGMGQIAVLASVVELADFVSMILDPNHAQPYELILIICFAARSGNPDRLHTRDFLSNANSLKSSLAYKLFKRMDDDRIKVRMSARLGEVRVSVARIGDSEKWANQVLTQTEAGVLAGLRMAEIGHEEMELKKGLSEKDQTDLRNRLREPANKAERDWLACIRECQELVRTQKAEEPDPNTGMLVYYKNQNDLVINFQGEIIYRGAML